MSSSMSPSQVHIETFGKSICCSVASRTLKSFPSAHGRTLTSVYCFDNLRYKDTIAGALPSKFSCAQFGSVVHPLLMGPSLSSRPYSSFFGGKGDKPRDSEVSAVSRTGEMGEGDSNLIGSDWADKLRDAWHGTMDATSYAGQKVKEASDEFSPYAQQLLESHPYLKNVILPVTYTMVATVLAWVVMPRILRRFHKYAMRGPVALFPGTFLGEEVPYEKSFWGALEDPIRYLLTFVAFSQM